MDIKHKLTTNQRNILRVLNRMDKPTYFALRDSAEIIYSLENGDYYNFTQIISHQRLGESFSFEQEFAKDLKGLEFLGLLKLLPENYNFLNFHPNEVRITEEGEKIAERLAKGRQLIFRPKGTSRTSIFVACAFGYEEIDKLFEDHLAPSCRLVGYEPIRVDIAEPTQTITELIMTSITEAECVIADLTHARPSVYFEVGYAIGLGIPILLTGRKDHYHGTDDKTRIHFDLEQYKISFWSINTDGKFVWNKGMNPKDRLAALIPNPKKSAKSKAG
ncbi:MAG: hypothetical protein HND47_17865 [Chloroflexi bacterium]|nr:hypothetical protein [Chloroflexota bacterium]